MLNGSNWIRVLQTSNSVLSALFGTKARGGDCNAPQSPGSEAFGAVGGAGVANERHEITEIASMRRGLSTHWLFRRIRTIY